MLLNKNKSERNAGATYTFADLMRDIVTSVLPERWCFIKLPDQIVFYHNENKVTTTVIINSSMDIIIQRFDLIKKVKMSDANFSFKNFEEFTRRLDDIQNMKICKGFYNQYKKRHLDCYRILLNMQEFSSIDIRCPYCRKLKVAIIKKLQAKSRINFKLDPTQHKILANKDQLRNINFLLMHLKMKVNLMENLFESLGEILKDKLSYYTGIVISEEYTLKF